MDPMEEMLREMMGKGKGYVETLTIEEMATGLKDAYAKYSVTHDFKPGDLVVKKPHSNYSVPEEGYPAIVVAIGASEGRKRDGDLVEGNEDMTIGVLRDGVFSMTMVSPLRFEPYTG